VACALGLAGCTGGGSAAGPASGSASASAAPKPTTPTAATTTSAAPAPSVPRWDHVVVVVEENHSYADIIGRPDAPYLNSLAGQGALFTSSFAVAHPSEPNYLALFSGSTQGIGDDSCPHTFASPNLGAQLRSAGLGFAGYSEGLPAAGSTVCSAGQYARKHSPWVDFSTVPASANLPFSAFPADHATLPTVSLVIPDLADDMHDGTVAQGDTWLRAHLDGYAQWARTHHSLLVVTWDEDDYSQANQVPTIIAGAGVRPGRYAERVDHYSVLRTLETAYGLPPIGNAASAAAITDSWAAG
jgi:phosphatidylinositol-3-phosphatase